MLNRKFIAFNSRTNHSRDVRKHVLINKKKRATNLFCNFLKANYQSITMNTKLILTIDQEIIEKAKQYAKGKNRSLSDIIENYLKTLTKED